jgi:hypothetical protein
MLVHDLGASGDGRPQFAAAIFIPRANPGRDLSRRGIPQLAFRGRLENSMVCSSSRFLRRNFWISQYLLFYCFTASSPTGGRVETAWSAGAAARRHFGAEHPRPAF